MPLVEEPSRQPDKRGTLRRLVFGHLPLEHETAAFILVSVIDFLMTYVLLVTQNAETGHRFVESNPAANFFLNRWGPNGLLGFKLGVVAFVCVVTQIVATKRVRTARWILNLGTAGTAVVVIYSLALLLKHG